MMRANKQSEQASAKSNRPISRRTRANSSTRRNSTHFGAYAHFAENDTPTVSAPAPPAFFSHDEPKSPSHRRIFARHGIARGLRQRRGAAGAGSRFGRYFRGFGCDRPSSGGCRLRQPAEPKAERHQPQNRPPSRTRTRSRSA